MQKPDVENSADLKSNFELLHRKWWPSIKSLMYEVVRESSSEGTLLREMSNYHLETGGKRLRAILPLLIAEALGEDPRRVVPFGAACEMLHNASLIHDDLQDGDEFRRGQPAVWKKYGTAQAINLGDAMIAHTILLMQRLDVPAALRERATSRVLLEMLRVIEGQVQELDLKSRADVTLADYMRIVEDKTARLFSLPMSGAALLCGVSEAVQEGLIEAARHIGVLFQIQDDILDIYGAKGRNIPGGDIGEGKRSVLVVHCLERIDAGEATWLKGVLDKPRDRTGAEDIAGVMAMFERAGSLTFASKEIARRRTAALEVAALADYPVLLKVLGEACDLFLKPMASIART
ncbi:MAG TPA: polyprenyl synthetase family protein [Pyrinomonadaceae bacterium]|nr:polyprenyl synthetase family protein [Pyrinomonadaceae bacterium]